MVRPGHHPGTARMAKRTSSHDHVLEADRSLLDVPETDRVSWCASADCGTAGVEYLKAVCGQFEQRNVRVTEYHRRRLREPPAHPLQPPGRPPGVVRHRHVDASDHAFEG